MINPPSDLKPTSEYLNTVVGKALDPKDPRAGSNRNTLWWLIGNGTVRLDAKVEVGGHWSNGDDTEGLTFTMVKQDFVRVLRSLLETEAARTEGSVWVDSSELGVDLGSLFSMAKKGNEESVRALCQLLADGKITLGTTAEVPAAGHYDGSDDVAGMPSGTSSISTVRQTLSRALTELAKQPRQKARCAISTGSDL